MRSDIRTVVRVGEEAPELGEDAETEERLKDRHLGKLVQVRLKPGLFDEFCKRAHIERRSRANFLEWWIEESFRRIPATPGEDERTLRAMSPRRKVT